MTLTCQLTDSSEVTDYEWVHVVYDLNGTQSVGSIQKGKTLSISKVSEENMGEWTCLFYGKEGILGNVTYHIQLMSKFSLLYDNMLQISKIYRPYWIDHHAKCHILPLFVFILFFPAGGLSGQKSSGLSHNTTAVVGLSFLLLVLLLILAQMYKNYQRVKICSS